MMDSFKNMIKDDLKDFRFGVYKYNVKEISYTVNSLLNEYIMGEDEVLETCDNVSYFVSQIGSIMMQESIVKILVDVIPDRIIEEAETMENYEICANFKKFKELYGETLEK